MELGTTGHEEHTVMEQGKEAVVLSVALRMSER